MLHTAGGRPDSDAIILAGAGDGDIKSSARQRNNRSYRARRSL